MESNILLYSNDHGKVSIQVRYEDGTFWLTQKRMAELFSVDVRTINEHLKNIFRSKELSEEGTIRENSDSSNRRKPTSGAQCSFLCFGSHHCCRLSS